MTSSASSCCTQCPAPSIRWTPRRSCLAIVDADRSPCPPRCSPRYPRRCSRPTRPPVPGRPPSWRRVREAPGGWATTGYPTCPPTTCRRGHRWPGTAARRPGGSAPRRPASTCGESASPRRRLPSGPRTNRSPGPRPADAAGRPFSGSNLRRTSPLEISADQLAQRGVGRCGIAGRAMRHLREASATGCYGGRKTFLRTVR